MCRLALFNSEFVTRMGKFNMTYMFSSLEAAMGGHGMGVAGYSRNVDDDENILIKKAVTMRPKAAASILQYAIKQRSMEYGLFHTRLATNGSISDFNCHPFISRDKRIVLAHNGSITEFSHSASDYTDSEIALHVISDFDLPLDTLENYNGVFVGIYYGTPFIIKGSSYSDLELALSKDNKAWCFASDFPYKSDMRSILTSLSFDIVNIPKLTWYGHDVVKVFLAAKKYNWNNWNNKTYHETDTGYWEHDYPSKNNQTSVSVYTPKGDIKHATGVTPGMVTEEESQENIRKLVASSPVKQKDTMTDILEERIKNKEEATVM